MYMYRTFVFCLSATLITIGCSTSAEDAPNKANSTGQDSTWLMETISRPEGPPNSPQALADHIQYAIQQQDREMLSSLFHKKGVEGFKPRMEEFKRTTESLLKAIDHKLTGIEVKKLSLDEIRKMNSQTFGLKVPVKLVPNATHEIAFTYQGRLTSTSSRTTAVYVGQYDGNFVIASYQIADE